MRSWSDLAQDVGLLMSLVFLAVILFLGQGCTKQVDLREPMELRVLTPFIPKLELKEVVAQEPVWVPKTHQAPYNGWLYTADDVKAMNDEFRETSGAVVSCTEHVDSITKTAVEYSRQQGIALQISRRECWRAFGAGVGTGFALCRGGEVLIQGAIDAAAAARAE